NLRLLQSFTPPDSPSIAIPVLRHAPSILNLGSENLLAKLQFFVELVGKKAAGRVVSSHPLVLTLSKKNLEGKVAVLSGLIGPENAALAVARFPLLLTSGEETMKQNYAELLREFQEALEGGGGDEGGIEGLEAGGIGEAKEGDGEYSWDGNMRHKVEYLKREMGLSIMEVLAFPPFLGFNLDRRIKTRHAALLQLGYDVVSYKTVALQKLSSNRKGAADKDEERGNREEDVDGKLKKGLADVGNGEDEWQEEEADEERNELLAPSLVHLSSQTLLSKLQYLVGVVGKKAAGSVVRSYSSILILSVENMRGKVALLGDLIGRENAVLAVARFPRLLSSSGENIQMCFRELVREVEAAMEESGGEEVRRQMLEEGARKLASGGSGRAFKSIAGLTIAHEMVVNLVVKNPAIICYNWEWNTRHKVDYLKRDMGLPVTEVLAYPHFLGYSLDQRIRPRHLAVLSKGYVLVPHEVALPNNRGEGGGNLEGVSSERRAEGKDEDAKVDYGEDEGEMGELGVGTVECQSVLDSMQDSYDVLGRTGAANGAGVVHEAESATLRFEPSFDDEPVLSVGTEARLRAGGRDEGESEGRKSEKSESRVTRAREVEDKVAGGGWNGEREGCKETEEEEKAMAVIAGVLREKFGSQIVTEELFSNGRITEEEQAKGRQEEEEGDGDEETEGSEVGGEEDGEVNEGEDAEAEAGACEEDAPPPTTSPPTLPPPCNGLRNMQGKVDLLSDLIGRENAVLAVARYPLLLGSNEENLKRRFSELVREVQEALEESGGEENGRQMLQEGARKLVREVEEVSEGGEADGVAGGSLPVEEPQKDSKDARERAEGVGRGAEARAGEGRGFKNSNGCSTAREMVANLVIKYLTSICYSWEGNTRRKIEYLKRDMGLSIKEVLAFPNFLTYSLDRRIRPRHLALLREGYVLAPHEVALPKHCEGGGHLEGIFIGRRRAEEKEAGEGVGGKDEFGVRKQEDRTALKSGERIAQDGYTALGGEGAVAVRRLSQRREKWRQGRKAVCLSQFLACTDEEFIKRFEVEVTPFMLEAHP
ncbi:unnamed protein product, partial [Closterium sp. Naga37s-1]